MIDDDDRVVPGSMFQSFGRMLERLERGAAEAAEASKRAAEALERIKATGATAASSASALREVVGKIRPEDVADVKADIRQITRSASAQAMIRAAARIKRIRDRDTD